MVIMVVVLVVLALGRKEFPVDTNVARVCARLGWIPLQVRGRGGISHALLRSMFVV